ncbi:hypothetical protein ANCDUO_00102 [Ancylostoma duodenale]|uniref:GIPC1-3 GH1 domain-containing protein n=1 Tax=Ancylostoma duodenale TaxID=51022 RepID=A0A0C2HIZ4_9BILA|nr:hypothetical protein ANCDUO_00102 [Ancylostoma duodenale]
MSSPTLSRVSSTISSHSLVEIFPFDSDIFVENSNSTVKKENKEVALRNPNTVALCPPPRMITSMSPRIPIGVPDMRGSFGGNVQPKPRSPTVRDLMRKLRKMSRVDFEKEASALEEKEENADKKELPTLQKKDENTDENIVTTPIPTKPPAEEAPMAPPPPHSKPRMRARALRRRTMPFRRVLAANSNPVHKVGNTMECSPFVVAARNLKFCRQLAHGSPTAIISNFASVDELFQSIADCFNISPENIIFFCTVQADSSTILAPTEWTDNSSVAEELP